MSQNTGLMQGKRGVVLGVANNRSIAWGIAKACHAAGAEIALTWQGDALKKRVEPLAQELGGLLLGHCDVTDLATQDPPVDAVRLLGDGVRVIVRPSGTEPKLKAYLESVVPVHDDAGIIAARGRGEDELDELRLEMSAALGL